MGDTNFDFRLTQATPAVLLDIAKIDELKGRWIAGAQLNPTALKMINAAGESAGVLFNTTPVCLTSAAMQSLVGWTQKRLKENIYHPLLVIGNFLVEFLNTHPFQDGNGRLSRIVTNLLLLKTGYLYMPYVSHEKLIEDNKPEYYLALRASQKTFKSARENITPWLSFFLKIVLRQSQDAVGLLSVQQIEKTLSKNQLAAWPYLSKTVEASPFEIAENARIARPTVNQALNKLMKLKMIERVGLGRGTRYRIAV